MFFLLSGEGPTDMGETAINAPICEGANFFIGPMAILASQIVETRHCYSFLDNGCGCVSENHLVQRAAELKAVKKAIRLPGAKQAKETRYFFNNARILARIAKEQKRARRVDVIAILFRDSDGTVSAGRGLWDDKWNSMIDGFAEENFEHGVPMIAKPKSEAWLIAGLRKAKGAQCATLEKRSGNDNSPNSLKKELERILRTKPTRALLCSKVKLDAKADDITMPSFLKFRERLESVI